MGGALRAVARVKRATVVNVLLTTPDATAARSSGAEGSENMKLAISVGVCAAVLAAGQASARDVDHGAPVSRITIDVKARIPVRCGFDQAPQTPAVDPDLDVARTVRVPFRLDCNAPFVIGVKSDHGALVADLPDDHSGFAFSKAYRVALDVGTNGQSMTPSDCDAAALTPAGEVSRDGKACAFFGAASGRGLSSGELISIGRPSDLAISWDARDPAAARNVAGRYADTLTIFVAART